MTPNPLQNVTQDEVLSILKNAQRILIAPSQPDGDSVGSALALQMVLERLGKEVHVVQSDALPPYLQFLPEVDRLEPELEGQKDFVISVALDEAELDHVKYHVENGKIQLILTPKSGRFSPENVSSYHPKTDFDILITVDTGDLVQLGKFYENNADLFKKVPILNIDHHASNGRFGSYNFLDFDVASTTQMLTPILQELEKEHGEELIDEEVATLLLVGLITDTGSFQHSNTTPEAFEVAAFLLDRGARQQEIIKHIFKTKSLATLRLWGRVLSKIHERMDLKMVYSTVTLDDLEDTGAKADDTGGIIDELLSHAPGAEIIMMLKEKEAGFISGSFRSTSDSADVSLIAQSLGGGGHKKAAGFRIKNKSMAEAVDIALQAVSHYWSPAPQEMPEPMQVQKPMSEPQVLVASEVTERAETPSTEGRLFPGLVTRFSLPSEGPSERKAFPQGMQSLPKVSAGGEDLLLKDFRSRQNSSPDLSPMAQSFFQDGDAQVKVETVEDALNRLQNSQ